MRNAMDEYDVSQHKEGGKNASSGSSSSSIVRVGEAIIPNKKKVMMKSVHHNHQHRPFSPFDNDSCGGDGDGPTTYMSFTNHINLVSNWNRNGNSNSGASSVLPPAAAPSVTPLQPFHSSAPNSNKTCVTTTFNFNSSAAASGGMAASLGVPFTNAQWKELERQAMIYKYMMASVPVPPDLLIPSSSSSSHLDGGFNLRLGSSSNTDPEPGRCRRTDGKKWRCSRDVAPNHKYCERHMHRGRPRSRKPVELHTNVNNTNTTCTTTTSNNKRPRHQALAFPTPPHVTVAAPNPSTTNSRHAPSFHFLPSTTTSSRYLQSSLSLHNYHFLPPVSSNKEPRRLEWMLNGDPISLGASNSEWQPLMHNKVGISSELSNPQYLNSFSLYSSGLEQQNRSLPLFLNPLVVPMENLQSEKPGDFIDAWSGESNGNTNNKNSASSIGKLSLPSLDLSMGVHENMGTIGMGLGLMDPADATNTHNNGDTKISLSNWLNPTPHHWVASTQPGGPLAEVLRPSTVTPTNEQTSNPSSPAITHVESNNSPLGTLVSSPSGVLQKTLASFSDSSSNSSPTVASSRTNHNSEMPFLWFGSNQM